MARTSSREDSSRARKKCESNPAAARKQFPRGLEQPPGSFRFSVDALLLASFLLPTDGAKILDIGTGCGVVALAMLCSHPHCVATGLDKEPLLVEAAKRNAERLGFGHRFSSLCMDIRKNKVFAEKQQPDTLPLASGNEYQHSQLAARSFADTEKKLLLRGSFEIILANPPYRKPQCGRLPQSPLRRSALFEETDSLQAFCRCAFQAIAPDGRFGIIYPWPRRRELFETILQSGLHPLRILEIHTKPKADPKFVLVESSKHPASRVALEQPILLYEKSSSGENTLTREALDFCPWLG